MTEHFPGDEAHDVPDVADETGQPEDAATHDWAEEHDTPSVTGEDPESSWVANSDPEGSEFAADVPESGEGVPPHELQDGVPASDPEAPLADAEGDGAAADPLTDAVGAALAEASFDQAWNSAGAVTGWSGTAVAPEPAQTAWAVGIEDPDPDYVDPGLLRP